MEVFVKNIPSEGLTTQNKLKIELANVLHAPPFRDSSEPLFNFEIYLFPNRRNLGYQVATLTLPTVELGSRFLAIYGDPSPLRTITIGASPLQFQTSTKPARFDVTRISDTPFQDPREAHAREERTVQLEAIEVGVSSVQLGRWCRDQVYSIEWEKKCEGKLLYKEDGRAFCVRMQEPPKENESSISSFEDLLESLIPWFLSRETTLIVIRASQIFWTSGGVDSLSQRPAIIFSLSQPPLFESEAPLASLIALVCSIEAPLRKRLTTPDKDVPTMPYISLAIRLECRSPEDLRNFHELANEAGLRVHDDSQAVCRRELFSHTRRTEYDRWVRSLPWTVAFQIEALLRSWSVDLEEVLLLRTPVARVLQEEGSRGNDYVSALLRNFHSHAKDFSWYGEVQLDGPNGGPPSLPASSSWVTELFALVRERVATIYQEGSSIPGNVGDHPFRCLHVAVTPTTMSLEGPRPERWNRVMRKYHQHQDCFLRVSFEEEDRLQLRFDREVDIRAFVNSRIRPILREGLLIAGHQFNFLAYSQSALKDHAVWFMKPFEHEDENGTTLVTVSTIIRELGDFRAIDPKLVYCPARWAARISQAFTATDASITVEAEDIRIEPDIHDSEGKYVFTDGVGTVSPALAQDMWRTQLARPRRSSKKTRPYPRSWQVRIQGAKGMLSVDHTLTGRTIILRPSMIKFESPNSRTIEIARAFDKPRPYFLNRPLIMILQGLGVPYQVFQDLQDDAVADANRSIDSLESSALLLEKHGLGTSFRLTSVMLNLHRLGLGPLTHDAFWQQMMKFAINHVLRDLKHRARIPVPGEDSWTLPGIADIFGELAEGEVFVCVELPERPKSKSGSVAGPRLKFLEGEILVSRSPTIHPGDVQVVRAIGNPSPGSHLEAEPLPNTVVFSTRGTRPLPSCLGGGDLDGDEYNVTTRRDLLPTTRDVLPASYEPANKKLVEHESTMADVADFVSEFITSDTVGIIATTWLMLADQSTEGIFDPECLRLAELHSAAVDYPKSGQPVAIDQIPRLRFDQRPDWSAPETVNDAQSFYESSRAIGRLFRSIALPATSEVKRVARFQRRHLKDLNHNEELGSILEQFYAEDSRDTDAVMAAVRERVSEFILPTENDDKVTTDVWEVYSAYVAQLHTICAEHTLSQSRSAMLTEAEAVIGTIVAKCSQPRKRKNLISQLREQTGTLASSIKGDIVGDDSVPAEESLRRAWAAYRLACMEGDTFGARSFAWIALGGIFDAIREIEREDE